MVAQRKRAPPSTDLVEISVEADGEATESISAVMGQYGIGGPVLEEVCPGDSSGPRTVRIKAFLLPDSEDQLHAIEEALWHLGRIYPIPDPQIRFLKRAEWEDSWKSGYRVLPIGSRFVIKPSWLAYQALPGQVVLELDPGMAFGTGLHPSTRLVLEAMEHHLQPSQVLDVGTGSGILSIAAAKLGAGPVLALEIDDLAIRVARDNIDRNHVEDIVEVRRATLAPVLSMNGPIGQPDVFNASGEFDGAFGTVLMNILAEVVAASAHAIARSLAPLGRFIVSGIIQQREETVLQALDSAGLMVRERLQDTDWVALVGTRREHPTA